MGHARRHCCAPPSASTAAAVDSARSCAAVSCAEAAGGCAQGPCCVRGSWQRRRPRAGTPAVGRGGCAGWGEGAAKAPAGHAGLGGAAAQAARRTRPVQGACASSTQGTCLLGEAAGHSILQLRLCVCKAHPVCACCRLWPFWGLGARSEAGPPSTATASCRLRCVWWPLAGAASWCRHTLAAWRSLCSGEWLLRGGGVGGRAGASLSPHPVACTLTASARACRRLREDATFKVSYWLGRLGVGAVTDTPVGCPDAPPDSGQPTAATGCCSDDEAAAPAAPVSSSLGARQARPGSAPTPADRSRRQGSAAAGRPSLLCTARISTDSCSGGGGGSSSGCVHEPGQHNDAAAIPEGMADQPSNAGVEVASLPRRCPRTRQKRTHVPGSGVFGPGTMAALQHVRGLQQEHGPLSCLHVRSMQPGAAAAAAASGSCTSPAARPSSAASATASSRPSSTSGCASRRPAATAADVFWSRPEHSSSSSTGSALRGLLANIFTGVCGGGGRGRTQPGPRQPTVHPVVAPTCPGCPCCCCLLLLAATRRAAAPCGRAQLLGPSGTTPATTKPAERAAAAAVATAGGGAAVAPAVEQPTLAC
jgi:hypothetical protein